MPSTNRLTRLSIGCCLTFVFSSTAVPSACGCSPGEFIKPTSPLLQEEATQATKPFSDQAAQTSGQKATSESPQEKSGNQKSGPQKSGNQLTSSKKASPTLASKSDDDRKKKSAIPNEKKREQEKKLTIREQRMEALRKQYEAEKENRPNTPQMTRRTRAGEPLELTFDDIKFPMKIGEKFKRSMITQDIRELHGKPVRLRGYIKPGAGSKNLTKFVFVRDDKECCFGPGAALYDCVMVTMLKDYPTDFSIRPVTIEGKFYLKEYLGPDGNVWAVYRMKNGRRR